MERKEARLEVAESKNQKHFQAIERLIIFFYRTLPFPSLPFLSFPLLTNSLPDHDE